VVALLVLGPKRLPEIARALGKGMAEFRRATADVTSEIDNARIMLEQEAREAGRRSAVKAEQKTFSRTASPGPAEPEKKEPKAPGDTESPGITAEPTSEK
jgi:TatA/E family protein of Tat protein translocase